MPTSIQPSLTAQQAYLAMFEFLRQHYERGPSDEIGGLLGSLSLLADGQPADAAMASDWQAAVTAVLSAEQSPHGYHEADLRLSAPPA